MPCGWGKAGGGNGVAGVMVQANLVYGKSAKTAVGVSAADDMHE